MGYFASAYVVEVSSDGQTATSITTAYQDSDPQPGRPLFFWSPGMRPEGLFSYARGTLLCANELQALPGYPSIQTLGTGTNESVELFQLDHDFRPRFDGDPVLFHFVLPAKYLPCPDKTPLEVPTTHSIVRRGDFLTATFTSTGQTFVRFWVRKLENDDSLDNYDLDRLFKQPSVRSMKASIEFNLGLLKFSLKDD